jgi:hypothetical protein
MSASRGDLSLARVIRNAPGGGLVEAEIAAAGFLLQDSPVAVSCDATAGAELDARTYRGSGEQPAQFAEVTLQGLSDQILKPLDRG